MSEILSEHDTVYTKLRELYTADEAKEWMVTPHRLLGDQTPHDAINAGRASDVLAVIEQLLTGAYA